MAGRVHGKVALPNNSLLVSQGGHVEAGVTANVVEIEGRVVGDIRASDKVVITATGHMEGEIVSPRVVLADGGRFKGSIDMDTAAAEDAKPAAQTSPKANAPPTRQSQPTAPRLKEPAEPVAKQA